ncbi:MAG: multicopper oxidase domain-containing protein, partial [Thalassobaculaceae bacterium]|nr:multicopper oxidase domain-containing protein [Thalassobaculaceae bacterium]
QLTLALNSLNGWALSSTNDAHIFHIHVNSFQMIARAKGIPLGNEYYQLPIWRDTVYFEGGSTDKNTLLQGPVVYTTSHQVDFTGKFVLHCHNLFHEDNGMMLTVSVQDS